MKNEKNSIKKRIKKLELAKLTHQIHDPGNDTRII